MYMRYVQLTHNLMKLKNFNWPIFLISVMVIGLVVFPSFFAAFAEDEGTLSPDYKFWNFFARLFYILRFPTHTLLWSEISEGGPLIYLGGLFVNCMFYGLVIERLASLLPKKKGI